MTTVVGLTILGALALVVAFINSGPEPPEGTCKECGAEPGEECDRWTHNGV